MAGGSRYADGPNGACDMWASGSSVYCTCRLSAPCSGLHATYDQFLTYLFVFTETIYHRSPRSGALLHVSMKDR